MPSTETSYPEGTISSLTVYFIISPSLYFGKFVNVPLQLFEEVNVNDFPPTASLSAYNVTITEAGLILSWLLLSSHIFSTGIFMVSGVCVFVTVNPLDIEPFTVGVYPVGGLFSLTV